MIRNIGILAVVFAGGVLAQTPSAPSQLLVLDGGGVPPPVSGTTCDDGNTSNDLYVRPGGTGNGRDWSNAFGNMPASIPRGSDVWIATGNYGSYTFDDAISGTTWINICKATEARHGTDVGWQSTYGSGTAVWSRWDLDTGYYNFDGAFGGGPQNLHGPFGFKVMGSSGRRLELGANAHHLIFKHLEATNSSNTPDNGASFGAIVYAFQNVRDITFSHTALHHVYGPVFHTGFSGYANWLVEHSKLGDNTGDSYHSEIWSMLGNDTTTIRYNYLFKWRSTGGIIAINGADGQFGSSNISEDVHIYGNVFDQGGTTAPYVIAAIDDASNQQFARRWKIHSNAFIGVNSSSTGVSAITLATTGETGNEARNNIWWGQTDTLAFAGVTRDFNWYSGSNKYGEANGIAGGSTDPFVNSASGDYRLASPLAGSNLSSPFDTDILGLVRGIDGTFDVGPYEF